MLYKIKKFFRVGVEQGKSTPPKTPSKTNNLVIHFYDQTSRTWTVDNWMGNKRVTPWVDFYKWYFAKDTEHFIFSSKTSDYMVKRKNIKTFCVYIHEVEDNEPRDLVVCPTGKKGI